MKYTLLLLTTCFFIITCTREKEYTKCFFECAEIVSNKTKYLMMKPSYAAMVKNYSKDSILRCFENVVVEKVVRYGSLKQIDLMNRDSITFRIGILDSIFVNEGKKLKAMDEFASIGDRGYVMVRTFNKNKTPFLARGVLDCNCKPENEN